MSAESSFLYSHFQSISMTSRMKVTSVRNYTNVANRGPAKGRYNYVWNHQPPSQHPLKFQPSFPKSYKQAPIPTELTQTQKNLDIT